MARARIMYWKPAPGHDPWERPDPSGRAIGNTWAEALRQGHTLPELEPIPSQEFVDAIRRKFPEAAEDEGVVRLDRPDADLVIRWTNQYVEVDARVLWAASGHAIDELAADFELDWFDFRW
jgi:hypothetical protein